MKFILFLCTLCAFGTLFAAMPGDRPGESPFKLEWLDCSPMPLGKIKKDIHKNIPPLRALVFMYTRASDSNRIVNMLENLRKQNYEKLLISIITPDSLDDAREFRVRHKDIRVRFAVDLERRLIPEYTRGSAMIFPMAFLMDESGLILWCGEAVDLPEAAELQISGKLNTDLQKKTFPMVTKMQQYMRDGNMFKTLTSAKAILDIDPTNASALRMAVFAAETLNQLPDAWGLTLQVMKKRPDLPRLYFTALDLAMRHPEIRKHLPQLIDVFNRKPFTIAIRCAFINTLLNNFPFDAQAVIGAEKILASTPMPLNALPGQMGMILMVRSHLRYLTGDLAAAESDSAEAVKCFKAAGERHNFDQAASQLAYYRSLLKHFKQAR